MAVIDRDGFVPANVCATEVQIRCTDRATTLLLVGHCFESICRQSVARFDQSSSGALLAPEAQQLTFALVKVGQLLCLFASPATSHA
jgi:hypothetical protein